MKKKIPETYDFLLIFCSSFITWYTNRQSDTMSIRCTFSSIICAIIVQLTMMMLEICHGIETQLCWHAYSEH